MDGREREEFWDLLEPKFFGCFIVVMTDELNDPVPVGFFCAPAEVTDTDLAVENFEEFGLTGVSRAANVHAFRPVDLVRLTRP